MSQFARPDADIVKVGWTDQAGGTANLWATIDETVASDADFIRSPSSPSSSVYVCSMTDVTDPVSSVNHVMRCRVSTDVASGGESLNFTFQLRQGYVSEASQGTLIASTTQNAVNGTGWVNMTRTLTSSEADSITNYNSLFYRWVVSVA